MRALPTLGGNNGFATGSNNRGQVVGWAENTVHDPTCDGIRDLGMLPGNVTSEVVEAFVAGHAAAQVRRSHGRVVV